MGKYAGAYTGCLVAKTSRSTRNYLGLALIPQAGVSLGLAALTKRIMPGAGAELVSTVILSSAVLYELLGPASAKFALKKSGAFSPNQAPPSEAPEIQKDADS